eukprot:444736-Prymnesium_polylepis.1
MASRLPGPSARSARHVMDRTYSSPLICIEPPPPPSINQAQPNTHMVWEEDFDLIFWFFGVLGATTVMSAQTVMSA